MLFVSGVTELERCKRSSTCVHKSASARSIASATFPRCMGEFLRVGSLPLTVFNGLLSGMEPNYPVGLNHLLPDQRKHVEETLLLLKNKFWLEEFSNGPSIEYSWSELGIEYIPCLHNQNEFVRKAHNFAIVQGSPCCVFQPIIFQYLCNAYDMEVDYNLQLALEGEEMSPSRKKQYLDAGVLGTQYLEQLYPEILMFSTIQEPVLGLKISDRIKNAELFQVCSVSKLGRCPICPNIDTAYKYKQGLGWKEFSSRWHDPCLEPTRKRTVSQVEINNVNHCLEMENSLLLKTTKPRIVL